MALLDLSKQRDVHIEERLRKDTTIYLNTVRPNGKPSAVTVWFLWDGASFLIFSRVENQKVRNIQHNSNVLLAIDNTHDGSDPISIEGTAELLAPGTVDTSLPAYVEKYGAGMKEIGLTPAQMAQGYSQAIRITPTRVL